jgi:putative toxin-antitoxin system toxin component, PIN family
MPEKRIVRIILDTNWYISASINRKSRRVLYKILTDPDIEVLYAKELLYEYKEVISRPKFNKIILEAQVLRFLNLILPRLKEITISRSVNLSRDTKDNYLLAMALDAEADFLVTGDDDLLVLEYVGSTQIVQMAKFLSTAAIV